MEIPTPYIEILEKNIKSVNNTGDIGEFVSECFEDLFEKLGDLDFQSRAKKSGDMFEYIFYFLLKENFDIDLAASVSIPQACMERGGKLDFGIIIDKEIVCGIEAKGSAKKIGNAVLKRPAMKRTDTVKKAICQAYQFKRTFPDKPFYIVTNVKPTSGNAKCMVDLAEGDIVDKVVNITNPKEVEWFVETLKKLANTQ